MEQEKNSTQTCPYCGNVASGHFCSECGRPLEMAPRTTMKLFWQEAAKSFASLTPGFWPTFVGLLLHPWEVVRLYVRGQRAQLSQPVTMMMQLLLYTTFFYTIVGHLLGIDFYASDEDKIVVEGHWLLTMMINSDVVAKVMIACAPAFSCYLTYGRFCGRRYYLAEYLAAAIYMGCSISIYFNLLKPLGVFFPNADQYVGSALVSIVGTIALVKAFPIRQRWRSLLMWLAFVAMNLLIFLAIVLVVTAVKMGGKS